MLTLFLIYAVLLLLWSLRPARLAAADEASDEQVAERARDASLSPPEGRPRVARRTAALPG